MKKTIIQEFKDFITRGNVLDMAVGVIIGGAFGAIINAVVNNILMPLISLASGDTDLSALGWVLNGVPKYIDVDGVQTLNPEAIILGWGTLLQAVINFLIIALVLFIIVKVASSLANARAKRLEEKKKAEEVAAQPAEPVAEPEPEPDPQLVLLTEIRDLLKKEDK